MNHATSSGKFPLIDRETTVYMVINKINLKRYVGATTRTLDHRRKQHIYDANRGCERGAFHAAIRKYGPSSFVWTVLGSFPNAKAGAAYESALIRSLAPEYNATPGGLGFTKRVLSDETRKKISDKKKGVPTGRKVVHTAETIAKIAAANRGRPGYWKGKKIPAHVIELARQRCLDRPNKSEILALGPKHSSKRTVCLNDGIVYESASAAGRAYGICCSLVSAVCKKRRRRAAGLVFRYYGDHLGGLDEAQKIDNAVYTARTESAKNARSLIKDTSHRSKPVISLDDGMRFKSAREAASHYGVHEDTVSQICRGLINGRKIKSIRLVYDGGDHGT